MNSHPALDDLKILYLFDAQCVSFYKHNYPITYTSNQICKSHKSNAIGKTRRTYDVLWQTQGNTLAPDASYRAWDHIGASGSLVGVCTEWIGAALGRPLFYY